MTSIHDLPTPALLLDLDRLESNIAMMQQRCDRLGVALRPHQKTHKCVEIGRMQHARGARGITVATLAEARTFADHGFDDITWAFPLIPSRLSEVRQIADRVRLRLTVDGEAAVDQLERDGVAIDVWLKIDCGYHRAGMDPAAPGTLQLARRLAGSSRLRFNGLLTHSGHAYHARTRAGRAAIAEEERRAVADLRRRLADEGMTVDASVGSTPAMTAVESLDGVTEARPGNYVFFDETQVALGSCLPGDVAVSVLASVVSAPAGQSHSVIDAGALALSKDTGAAEPVHYGKVDGRSGVVVGSVSQEHGVLTDRLPYGERVRIVPNHSCLTVACFDRYHVVRGEAVVDEWAIHRQR
ncbi:MAG: alanine racemase [Gemmatimonadales bacterium]